MLLKGSEKRTVEALGAVAFGRASRQRKYRDQEVMGHHLVANDIVWTARTKDEEGCLRKIKKALWKPECLSGQN
jgi:hypothetical protein